MSNFQDFSNAPSKHFRNLNHFSATDLCQILYTTSFKSKNSGFANFMWLLSSFSPEPRFVTIKTAMQLQNAMLLTPANNDLAYFLQSNATISKSMKTRSHIQNLNGSMKFSHCHPKMCSLIVNVRAL